MPVPSIPVTINISSCYDKCVVVMVTLLKRIPALAVENYTTRYLRKGPPSTAVLFMYCASPGQQLRDNLFSLATHDHSNNDAVLVTILSHGLEGKIYGTDGDLVDVAEFTSYFRGNVATSLAGKPKIFILQACRGGTFDTGIDATDGEESGVLETEEELFQRFLQSCPANRDNPDAEIDGHLGSLPVEADMLMAYATVPGYVSWRNSERGSWFVQALVKVCRHACLRACCNYCCYALCC